MKARVLFLPMGKQAQVRSGVSVLDAARSAGVTIRTRCGGKAGCLMCKVICETGAGLSPLNANERLKLAGMAEQGYRLGCQAKVTGDATIHIPEDPLRAAVAKLLAKQQEDDQLW